MKFKSAILMMAVCFLEVLTADEPPESGDRLVQYGKMHEVIGMRSDK
jgi:hypothetical protein